jgi:hypothetical protein
MNSRSDARNFLTRLVGPYASAVSLESQFHKLNRKHTMVMNRRQPKKTTAEVCLSDLSVVPGLFIVV